MRPRSIFALILIFTVSVSAAAFGQDGMELELELSAPAAEQAVDLSPTPTQPTTVDPDFDSPKATMLTFMTAMERYGEELEAEKENTTAQQQLLERAIGTLKLNEASRERGPTLAKRLLLTLNRLGSYPHYYLWDKEQAEGREEQTYFPHWRFDSVIASRPEVKPEGSIVLTKQTDGRWLFSEQTVAGLDGLYRSLEPLPIIEGADEDAIEAEGWLRQRMPDSLKRYTFLSIEYWQWAALLVLVCIGVAIDHLSRLFAGFFATRMIRRRGAEPDPESVRLFVLPVGRLLMAVFWLSTLWLLDLPGMAYPIIHGTARVFAILATAWAVWRLTDLVINALLSKAEKTDTKFDDVVYPMVRTMLRIFIVVFTIIYGGLALNINVWPALTAVGIGGIGFAFAAKDTIENFFGSATVLIDRPFGVGDWVAIGDVEGTVEQIGFRSTRIRTFYNSLITVPNANLVRAAVDNYGKRRYRRWKCNVGVQYDTSPEKLVAFCEGVRELVRTHPYTRKDYFQVWLNQFGASSLDILIYVFFETPDWSTELRERERMMLDMMRLANKLGVDFAFPTQTVHFYNEEHGAAHSPAESPGSMTDRRAMVEGIRTVHDLVAKQPWLSETPGPVTYKHGPTKLDGEDDSQIEQRSAGG